MDPKVCVKNLRQNNEFSRKTQIYTLSALHEMLAKSKTILWFVKSDLCISFGLLFLDILP
jgi:hypothetical protein